MIRVLSLVITGLILASWGFAEPSYKSPEIGTQITWQGQFNKDGRDKRISKVVARGEDFAIYVYDLFNDLEEPLSYFVEFSGIHITSCAYQMPSKRERENLMRFWPLQAGRSVEVGSADTVLTTYKAGQRTSYAVSQIDGKRPAQYVTVVDGDIETSVVVSLDWGTTVRFGWDDGENDRAIEMFSPVVPETPANLAALGECAQLLDE